MASMSSDPFPGNFPDEHTPQLPEDGEIEARLERVRDGLSGITLDDRDEEIARVTAAAELPRAETDDLDARLEALRAKSEAAIAQKQEQERQARKDVKSQQEASYGLGVGLSVSYTLIGMPVLGAVLGLILNKLTGGNAWTLIGVLGGFGLGLFWVVLVTNRQDKK